MRGTDVLFVLVHSPLTGPLTWSLVAEQLRQRGLAVAIPALADGEESNLPYWQQHAESVARALGAAPPGRSLVLVGHSGAGPLLPAIRERLDRPVAAYLFVDAGLPADGQSRLDEMMASAPEFAARLQQHLASGGLFPTWSDAQLREFIPNERLRQGVLAELRPRSLAFFTEPLPVFTGWPDAPCGYLLLSSPYRAAAEQARRAGWANREFDAGHFHLLVDPAAVTDALLSLVQTLLKTDY